MDFGSPYPSGFYGRLDCYRYCMQTLIGRELTLKDVTPLDSDFQKVVDSMEQTNLEIAAKMAVLYEQELAHQLELLAIDKARAIAEYMATQSDETQRFRKLLDMG